MKPTWKLVVLLLAAVALFGAQFSDADERKNSRALAQELAKAIQGKSFSMTSAVQVAEKKIGGRAVAAKVDIENGKAVVEVMVLKTGPQPLLYEVEVDGATGRVLEVEEADDDDGNDEDENDDEEEDDRD